jgi:ribonuclease HI
MRFARQRRKSVVTNELSYQWRSIGGENSGWTKGYVKHPEASLQAILEIYQQESRLGIKIEWVSWHINKNTNPLADRSIEVAFRTFVRELRRGSDA